MGRATGLLAGPWDCKGSRIGGVWDKWATGNYTSTLTYLSTEWWLLTVGEPVVPSGVTGAVNTVAVMVMVVAVVVVVDAVVVAWHINQITLYSACQPAHSLHKAPSL